MPPKNAQPRVKGNARPASSRYVPPCPFPPAPFSLPLSLPLYPVFLTFLTPFLPRVSWVCPRTAMRRRGRSGRRTAL